MKALRRKIIRAYLTAGPTDHVFYDNTVLAYQVPGYLNNGTIKQLCVTKQALNDFIPLEISLAFFGNMELSQQEEKAWIQA